MDAAQMLGHRTWAMPGLYDRADAGERYCAAVDASEALWIDVSMWSGLSGAMQPYMDVQAELPEQPPRDEEEWQEWARAHLGQVAERDNWQTARYHYTVEQRDPSGRTTETYAQDFWEWQRPAPESMLSVPH